MNLESEHLALGNPHTFFHALPFAGMGAAATDPTLTVPSTVSLTDFTAATLALSLALSPDVLNHVVGLRGGQNGASALLPSLRVYLSLNCRGWRTFGP